MQKERPWGMLNAVVLKVNHARSEGINFRPPYPRWCEPVRPVADRPLVSHEMPAYPEWGKRDGVEAKVSLYFIVLPNGGYSIDLRAKPGRYGHDCGFWGG